jgi:hypothetical protein
MNRKWFQALAMCGCRLRAERWFIESRFHERFGRPIDWDNPRTFNEKIQWLKLYYRHPRLPQLADKVRVREFIRQRVGDEYVMPVLGIYGSVRAFAKALPALPDDFIIKANHASGWNMFVRGKHTLTRRSFRRLRRWLGRSYYYRTFEWVYRGIKPKLVVEPLIEPLVPNREPIDYRVFCYGGKPKWVQADCDRFSGHYRGLFTTDWTPLDVEMRVPRSVKPIAPPSRLDEILKVAAALSEGLPFLRVDTYCEGRVQVGELTLYPANGLCVFTPAWGNELFGEDLELREFP